MLPQYQPTSWSCLPTAFAIALNERVKIILEEIGHTGSENMFPELPEPYCRRGFHYQELIQCCEYRDTILTAFEPCPVSETMFGQKLPIKNQRMHAHYLGVMKHSTGVIIGTNRTGHPHSFVWLGNNRIIDPALGKETSIDGYSIQIYCRLLNFHDALKVALEK